MCRRTITTLILLVLLCVPAGCGRSPLSQLKIAVDTHTLLAEGLYVLDEAGYFDPNETQIIREAVLAGNAYLHDWE